METDKEKKKESVNQTIRLVESLMKVVSGKKPIEQVSKQFAEEINKKYLYNKHGGKKNFEQKLQKELKKTSNKQKKP